MGATQVREAARRELGRLSRSGLDVPDFVRAATRVLKRAVPCESACLLTVDPATMLPTSEISELSEREPFRPAGPADELRATLPGITGAWGALTLLRESGHPRFSAAEVRFVESVAAELGDGLRRSMLLVDDHVDEDTGPGFVSLNPDDTVQAADVQGDHWLGELGDPPLAVWAAAARARRGDEPAEGRVRTPAGQWLVVRGSLLSDGRVAVLIETAGPTRLAPLIAEAYGLSARERLVTELVARGRSTNEIAARLHLSAYTIQDHLKSIFAKCDVASRGDLVARVFFHNYEPTLTATRIAT
ncbi:helix-turn-helix transcriptional regulator [Actinoplanes sp. CA-054009]